MKVQYITEATYIPQKTVREGLKQVVKTVQKLSPYQRFVKSSINPVPQNVSEDFSYALSHGTPEGMINVNL